MMKESRAASLADRVKSLLLYPLPHHGVSGIVHRATRWRLRPWKNWLIRTISRRYGVDLADARERNPGAYEHFNAFFTRELAHGARPLPAEPRAIACPADGTVSELGALDGGHILQAKGHRYTASALLGGDEALAARFQGGHFLTVYLSPRDYHRVHMPLGGRLRRMIHVPGRLFSVAPHTVRAVPGLFARNERVVTLFDTDAGPMALVLVGAICVASIETVWAGEVVPPRARRVTRTDYDDPTLRFIRGSEIGRFNMGSTVIVLFPRGKVDWSSALRAGDEVRMGQAVGRLVQAPVPA
jgi:phosphatidylserine decarboxylase